MLVKLEVAPTSEILLKKKVSLQVFSYEFGEIFKKLLFRTAASE